MAGKLLTIKDVQDILGISERTAFRLIKSNNLKGFKIGREWRFEESDIEDYIRQQRQKSNSDVENVA